MAVGDRRGVVSQVLEGVTTIANTVQILDPNAAEARLKVLSTER
jgi:hypothetical protein